MSGPTAEVYKIVLVGAGGTKTEDEFRFRLKAANGEVVAQSEGYTRKQSVLDTLALYFPDFELVDRTAA